MPTYVRGLSPSIKGGHFLYQGLFGTKAGFRAGSGDGSGLAEAVDVLTAAETSNSPLSDFSLSRDAALCGIIG